MAISRHRTFARAGLDVLIAPPPVMDALTRAR